MTNESSTIQKTKLEQAREKQELVIKYHNNQLSDVLKWHFESIKGESNND